MQMFFVQLYVIVLTATAVYGVFGLITLYLYWRHRHEKHPTPLMNEMEWPHVTVQLPLYNERYVVERLIHATVQLDYPVDKLEIQVLDDSTDETVQITQRLVDHYRRQGVNIVLYHREHRQGYKAGALAEALAKTNSEYIAIFDADFCPSADFLQRTIPHFVHNKELGVVQTRWDHLNQNDSILTGAQSIAIDKHFVVDQAVRSRANLFPKFNGSGGIFRRSCMEDAGGWHDDTVCEDLCLSTRAVLRGWRFLILPDIVAPAELPNTISAYKNQQARWAKGSFQCLQKFFFPILKSRKNTIGARIYGILAMSIYFGSPLVLLLLAMQLPILMLDIKFSPWLAGYSVLGIGQPIVYVVAQRILHHQENRKDWWRQLRYMPAMFIIAIGVAPSQTRAIIEVLIGRFLRINHTFVRTPKGEQKQENYRLPFDWIILIELFFALYVILTLFVAISMGHYGSIVYLAISEIGLLYVLSEGIKEQLQTQKQGAQQREQAVV